MLNQFRKSTFLKNSAILMSGTLVAQAIPTVISPLLTRIYTPESFGILMVYVSTLSILGVIATLRYEKAIIIPIETEKGEKLLTLTQVLITVSCIILSFVNLFFGDKLLELVGLSDLKPYSWLLIVGLFVLTSDQNFYHWANRISAYKKMSYSKVANNLSSAICSIIFGLLNFQALGLLLSKVMGLFASLLINASTFTLTKLFQFTKADLKEIAIENKKYPTYILPGHLLNAVALNGPPIMLAMYFTQKEVGFFALTQRVVMLPVSIISRSVSDVFRQKGVDLYNTTGNYRTLYLNTMFGLAVVGLVPLIILIVLGPWLFSIFFGAQWIESGYLAQILAFLFYFQFISSPLTSTFIISDKQQLELVWQILFLISSLASIALGYYFLGTLKQTLIVFVVARSIVYFISILLTLPHTVKN